MRRQGGPPGRSRHVLGRRPGRRGTGAQRRLAQGPPEPPAGDPAAPTPPCGVQRRHRPARPRPGDQGAALPVRLPARRRDGRAGGGSPSRPRPGPGSSTASCTIDQLSSPLAKDPEGFLAPFHESPSCSTRSRRARPAASPRPPRRPPAARSACCSSDRRQRQLPHARSASATRRCPRSRCAASTCRRHAGAHVSQQRAREADRTPADGRLQYGQRGARSCCARHWSGPTRSSSTGARRPPALFSLVDPGTTRVIVRLHSFEAFTGGRTSSTSRASTTWSSSPTTCATSPWRPCPRLTGPGAPRLHVLNNAMDLTRLPRRQGPGRPLHARPDRDQARSPRTRAGRSRCCGCCARTTSATACCWSASELEPRPEPGRRALLRRPSSRHRRAGAAGRRAPAGPDATTCPKALTEVGVILSTLGARELPLRPGRGRGQRGGPGRARLAVLRRRGRTAPARSSRHDWVADTPEEAAARILEAHRRPRRAGGRPAPAASAHALATWDWSVVAPGFDRLILGEDQPDPAATPAAAATAP